MLAEPRAAAPRDSDPAGPPQDLESLWPKVLALGDKYRYDAAHAQQVSRLAGRLFDALAPIHGLAAPWRTPLQHAALLHDIGYFVRARGHHRHSRYLIRHDALAADYPAPWRELVALVACNHRRRLRRAPRGWSREHRAAATGLAALLRIADGLDYGHNGAADLGSVATEQGRLRIEVSGVRLGRLEPVLRKKSGLFVRTFALPVGFVAAAP